MKNNTAKDTLPGVTKPEYKVNGCLKGQSAIVTGASSGIGKAVAIGLASAGASVGVNYRDERSLADAEEVITTIKAAGGEAIAVKADISIEAEVDDMFKKTIEAYGTVDILVNNAGLQQDAPIDEMSLQQWNTVIGVNLTGQFLCARAAIREFKKRGVNQDISCAAGKIICMSSVHDVIPWAGHANYAASKGGVMLLMKTIAQECAPFRIRCNSICPGAIRTPINEGAAWGTPELEANLNKLIPYNRIGEPEDIAQAAIWLSSDSSDYINGINMYIDGGMTLYPGFAEGG